MADSQSTSPDPASPQKKPRYKDHAGKRFGRLVALRFNRCDGVASFWIFRCDCGSEVEKRINSVLKGVTTSCGCLHAQACSGKAPMRNGALRKVQDLTGQRFGRLLVLKEVEKHHGITHRRWAFCCDCGQEGSVEHRAITSGHTKSCGCIQKEKAAEQAVRIGHANTTHGRVNTPEWVAWRGMHARCYDKEQPSFKHYGGRGITVCERWHEFVNFFADMGERPSEQHSLGRKETNGNYEPENCEWQTPREQQRNRRSNRLLTINGVTKCCSEWAEETGISTSTLNIRLKYGWPPDLAVLTPSGVIPPELKHRRLPVDPMVRLKADTRAFFHQAIKKGKIKRSSHCEYPGCLEEKVTAHHHHGYECKHALDVIWLCRRHHEEADHPKST